MIALVLPFCSYLERECSNVYRSGNCFKQKSHGEIRHALFSRSVNGSIQVFPMNVWQYPEGNKGAPALKGTVVPLLLMEACVAMDV